MEISLQNFLSRSPLQYTDKDLAVAWYTKMEWK